MIIFLSTMEQDEKQLVTKLYNELNPMMYKIALNYLRNKEEAEEAVSSAFIKIMENIKKISKLSCPKMHSYCVSILKNESINILRKEKKFLDIDEIEDFSKDDNSLEEKVFKTLESEKLIEQIEKLEEIEKQLLYFRYVENLSYKKIGKLLNISENSANKRNQRIIQKLKNLYKEGGTSER